ncbi:MAG: glutathione peroxidase [Aquisalimonadaceae bacterium]
MIRLATLVFLAMLIQPGIAADRDSSAPAGCPAWLNHELRQLHSDEVIDLCERYGGKPLLVINTASHCGYTRQFEGLEALHAHYKESGLRTIGFPSNDFRQEASDEAKTAEVCRINYGVTFDMFSPLPVTGADAHPVFQEIARQSQAPGWNFYKYVIDRDGRVVAAFPNRVEPDADELREAIESVL